MTVIDDYLKKFAPSERTKLERIREIARQFVPNAEEVIGYGMPTLRYHDKAFLGFDLHKNHIGIYPYGGEEIVALQDKLAAYKTTKGAIQVPLEEEFPEELLKEIIRLRI